MQSASNITNSNKYEVVVYKVTVIENNVSTLKSYTISNGTNFGIGPNVFQDLTTRTQNTAIGNSATGGTYGLTTGSKNVMVGYNSGSGCETGSNNTFLGANTQFLCQATALSGVLFYSHRCSVNSFNFRLFALGLQGA